MNPTPIVFNLQALAKAIAAKLRVRRSALMQETALQDVIEEAIKSIGLEYHREHAFDAQDRVDFFLSSMGWAIEVKKKNAGFGEGRQLARYLSHEECNGCLLVALKITDPIPPEIDGKPVCTLELWKLLL